MTKRDNTFLFEKLCYGVKWEEFTKEEKWIIYALQSSDYLYHTHFIRQESAPDHHTMYKVNNELELRIQLRVFNER